MTDLARQAAAGTVYIEKDLRDHGEQFRDIVPLASVLLEELLIELIKGAEPQGEPHSFLFY